MHKHNKLKYTSTGIYNPFYIEQEEGIPPTFIKPMKIQYTEEENKATITCQVHGKPIPSVQWYKGEEIVIPSENVQPFYEEINGTVALEVYNPIPNEVTTYTVQAENTFGRAIGKAQLLVEAPIEPQIANIITKPIERAEILKAPRVTPLAAQIIRNGGTLTFTSTFEGIPEPTITWLKNGKELQIDSDVTINTINYNSIVTIKNMNRKRAGKYEIVAINKVGEARSSGSVVVSDTTETEQVIAPRFLESLHPKTVQEDDVVILETIVQSHPISSFQWFVNSTPIKSSPQDNIRITIKENKSILFIKTFRKENVGIYTCRAENVAGSVTSTASYKIAELPQMEEVTEFISPRFIEKIKSAQLMDGEQLLLSCQVIGNPIPKIEWYRNKQILEEIKGITISQEINGLCTLTITEVFPEDAGEYTCYASNKIGEALCTATVSVEGIFFYEYV